MEEKVFPAIGWRDDITVIMSDREEEQRITETLRKSAVQNRITFSEAKCKVLILGKKTSEKGPRVLQYKIRRCRDKRYKKG